MSDVGTTRVAPGWRSHECDFDSGGHRCHGWFYRPASDPPYPCVVMAHGLGAAPGRPLSDVARRFAQAGIAALAFDFRGFGASEGRPRAVVNVDRQLDDWAAALAYARAREDVDPELVGAWGSSFTGGHVFAVAARDHRLAGAVAQVPYCDGFALARAAGIWRNLRLLPAVVRDLLRAATGGEPYLIDALGPPRARAVINARFPELADQILSQVPSSANKTAARSLLELYRFRPLDHVAEIRCPLLVVLSYEDHVAPPDSAMQLAVRSPFVELAMFHARHFDLYTGDTRERALRTELTFMTHHLDRLRAPAPALASV